MNKYDTNLPLKRYRKEFDFDITALVGVGFLVGILFQILLNDLVNKTVRLWIFAFICMITVVMILPSKKNHGHKVLEEYSYFCKYCIYKVKGWLHRNV